MSHPRKAGASTQALTAPLLACVFALLCGVMVAIPAAISPAAAQTSRCSGGVYAEASIAKANFGNDCGNAFQETPDHRCDWVPGGWQCTGPGQASAAAPPPEAPPTPIPSAPVSPSPTPPAPTSPANTDASPVTADASTCAGGVYTKASTAKANFGNDCGNPFQETPDYRCDWVPGGWQCAGPASHATCISSSRRDTISDLRLNVTPGGELEVRFIGDCEATAHVLWISDGDRSLYRTVPATGSSARFPVNPYRIYSLNSRSKFGATGANGEGLAFSLLPMTGADAATVADAPSSEVHVVWSAHDVGSTQDAVSSAGTSVFAWAAGTIGTSPFTGPPGAVGFLSGLAYSLDGLSTAADAASDARQTFDATLDSFLTGQGLPTLAEPGAYGHNLVYPEVQAWENFRASLPGLIADEFGRAPVRPYELARFVDGLVTDFTRQWGQPGLRDPLRPSPLDSNCPGSVGCNDDYDRDNDGTPDLIDDDIDGDGIANSIDRYPETPFRGDLDGDGTADFDDSDIDGDGIPNGIDADPRVPSTARPVLDDDNDSDDRDDEPSDDDDDADDSEGCDGGYNEAAYGSGC